MSAEPEFTVRVLPSRAVTTADGVHHAAGQEFDLPEAEAVALGLQGYVAIVIDDKDVAK